MLKVAPAASHICSFSFCVLAHSGACVCACARWKNNNKICLYCICLENRIVYHSYSPTRSEALFVQFPARWLGYAVRKRSIKYEVIFMWIFETGKLFHSVKQKIHTRRQIHFHTTECELYHHPYHSLFGVANRERIWKRWRALLGIPEMLLGMDQQSGIAPHTAFRDCVAVLDFFPIPIIWHGRLVNGFSSPLLPSVTLSLMYTHFSPCIQSSDPTNSSRSS